MPCLISAEQNCIKVPVLHFPHQALARILSFVDSGNSDHLRIALDIIGLSFIWRNLSKLIPCLTAYNYFRSADLVFAGKFFLQHRSSLACILAEKYQPEPLPASDWKCIHS